MALTPFKRCIFFLIDGARADVLEDMLQAEELPALKKYVSDSGIYQTAVSVFPSTSGPAHAPFITGCTPGTCNIPGIRWFDRAQPNGFNHFKQSRSYLGPGSFYMDADLNMDVRTIFEYFDRPAGVFSFLNRGLGLTENKTLLTKEWYWMYAHFTGHWQAVDNAAWRYIDRAVDRRSDFIFVVFPAVDEYSHHTDPFSEATYASYRSFDRAFGKMAERLHRNGQLEDTLFVLSSDHGLTATHTHFELWKFLDNQGLKTVYYPKILKNGCNAASMISGNGMAHVYLKHRDTWQSQPTYQHIRNGIADSDLIEALLDQEAVDLVAARHENGSIMACSNNGIAEIQDTGTEINYRISGGDPFGYTHMTECMTYDQSIEATFDSDYPDAPYQLSKLFNSPRTGDLIVSARKGYDLRLLHERPEHFATHGSLHREHMRVPLLMNAEISRPYVRTVDVFPSILEHMGRTVENTIDGNSFVSHKDMEGVYA